MIADVWRRRDFIALGMVLVGVLLVVLARLVDSSLLGTIGIALAVIGAVRFILWRVTGHHPREWV